MNILLTNDDGYDAPGLKAMLHELDKHDDIQKMYVAPHKHMSAKSHSVTIFEPLKRYDYLDGNGNLEGVSIDGTPVDCVNVALDKVFETKPDLLISGINDGGNFSTIALLSGTYAAAEAGAKAGIPSIAVSLLSGFGVKAITKVEGVEGIDPHILESFLTSDRDFSVAADFVAFFVKTIMPDLHIDGTPFFNINVPPLKREDIKGWKFTSFSQNNYSASYQDNISPQGEQYYWYDSRTIHNDMADMRAGTDDIELFQGYITVTPSKIDFTDHQALDALLGQNFSQY